MNTRNLMIGAAVALTSATLIFAASANAGGLLGGVGGGLGGGLTRSPSGFDGALNGNIAGHTQVDRDSLDRVRSHAARTTDTAKDTAKNTPVNASSPPATSKSPEPAAVQTHHVDAAAAIDAE
jgi:hypothetical protein